MRSTQPITTAVALTLFGLGCLLLCHRAAPILPAAAPHPVRARVMAPPPRDAAETALRRAAECRTRAKIAVNGEREGWEGWDPRASEAVNADDWRLRRLAEDPGGDLHQAQEWARRAAALARSPGEAYRAAELQVLLAHELGHHQAELRQARRLPELAPGSERARSVLARAAACHRRHAPAPAGRA